jgi:MEMO1 family protein
MLSTMKHLLQPRRRGQKGNGDRTKDCSPFSGPRGFSPPCQLTWSRAASWGLVLCLCAVLMPAAAQAQTVVRLRAPAVAGAYYPAEPAQLRETLERYFAEAQPEPLPGRLLACIAPQAAYGFAGKVMASAFKEIEPGAIERVVILSPSNVAEFFGCSIPSVQAYLTPIGAVPLDGPAIRTLTYSPLIGLRSVRSDERGRRHGIHEREFGIEVLLPFLQARLGNSFKLVPIVVGQLARKDGQNDPQSVASVVESLRRIVDRKTLVVVSSNFTQYGEIFGYVPFKERVYEQIENLDRMAFDYILRKDVNAFRRYLQLTRNPVAGHLPIEILLQLLPDTAQGRLHDYTLSGRLTNSQERSVSYGAINFYDVNAPGRSSGAAPDDSADTGEEP